VTVDALAAELCVSASHLRRVVQSNTGVSLSEYISRQKVVHAKRLLVQTDATVNYIAKLLKFTDVGYFFRLFKKYTGQTCGEYRASQRALKRDKPTE
jgi:AraC-like DNA-binding protein